MAKAKPKMELAPGLSNSLHRIPKVELHAHLNGSIPPDLLRTLAEERSLTLSEEHFSPNSRPRSLADCFDLFAELPRVINDLDALRRITLAALEFFAQEHVVYLELRSTPKRLWKDFRVQNKPAGLATKRDYVDTVLNVISDFNQAEQERYSRLAENSKRHARLPMVCRFIVSIDRSASIQEAYENLQAAVEFQSTSLIVGIDLGGNPTKQSFKLFEPIFQKARTEYGLKCTIHCAEVENNEYLDIIKFRPDRLGHAVLMPPESFSTLKIPVETCPTSNLLTLELNHHTSTLQSMNVRGWIADGYPIAVCTDDPGIFRTTPTHELCLLKAAFNDVFDIERAVIRSLSFGFAEPQLLESIATLAENRFAAIIPKS